MRPPSKTEIYIWPNVTVPPTTVTDQYGIEPGFPIPADGNATTAALGLTGGVRDGSAAKLPMEIVVQGIAAYTRGLEGLRDRALTGNDIRIHDIIAQVKRGVLLRQSRVVAVPRFSVQRADLSAQLGVAVDFAPSALSDIAWPTDWAPPTGGAAGHPSLCRDASGRLLLTYLLADDNNSDRCKLFTHRYDQAADDDWQVVTDEDSDILTPQGGVAADAYVPALVTPTVATVLYRGEVYAILAGHLYTAPLAQAQIVVYRLNRAEDLWQYVAGPVPISIGTGVLCDGGVTAVALSDRVVVALGGYTTTTFGVFPSETRSIWIGSSSDLTTWSDMTDNAGGFTALGDFARILPQEEDGTLAEQVVNAVGFSENGLQALAGTQSGRIYRSLDGGLTWGRVAVPTSTAIYAIQFVPGSSPTVAYACGAAGLVLKSTDTGETWKVVSLGQGLAAELNNDDFLQREFKTRPAIGEQPLYGMAWYNDQVGWLVGENKIAVTESGGASWKDASPPNCTATYTCVQVVSTTLPRDHTILVGGIIKRNKTSSPKDLNRYQFVRITTAVGDTQEAGCTFQNKLDATNTGARIEALFKRDSDQFFACGRRGVLIECVDQTAGSPTWDKVGNKDITARDLVSLYWREGSTAGTHEFLVLTADGTLLRSNSSGSFWTAQHVSAAKQGRVVYSPGSATVLVGDGLSLWRTDLTAQFQALPSLIPLSGGEALLACANLQQGRVSLYRTGDRGVTWGPVEIDDQAVVTFDNTAQIADYSAIAVATPRPTLIRLDDGAIALLAADRGVVNPSGNGDEWVAGDDPSLPLPLGVVDTTSLDTTWKNSRTGLAYGAGRLFTIVRRASADGWRTQTAREWSESSVTFMPVIPGVPQWVGVDDLRIIFPVSELPQGEAWTIPARYRFGADHLAEETRTQFWRGSPDGDTPADLVLSWDRANADTDALVGTDGLAWFVEAAALFGTDFRRVTIRVSNPGYNSATPPGPADTVSVDLDGTLEEAVVTLAPDGSNSPVSVLHCQEKAWIPHQWAPSLRTYYVEVGTKAYQILDNTENALLIARDSNTTAIAAETLVRIYGDRFFTDFGGMLTSVYRWPRWVQIIIPAQPTALGYRKIEALAIGPMTASEIVLPEGVAERETYDRSFRWRAEPSVLETRAQEGPSAVEILSRPIQRWALSYSAMSWFEADALTLPMLAQTRRAFALAFDGGDPQRTVEWVRLAPDSSLPERIHSGGDLYGIDVVLNEVP